MSTEIEYITIDWPENVRYTAFGSGVSTEIPAEMQSALAVIMLHSLRLRGEH